MSVVILLPLLLLIQAIGFGIGIVLIVGAVKMMRLKSHGLATAAGVLAMLPCGPSWLLGLPMGIWSLVVLNRQNVKAAFQAQATRQPAERPSGARPGMRTRLHWWFETALVLISLVLLASWFGPAMLARWSNKGLLEIKTDDAIKGAQVLVMRGADQVALIDAERRPLMHLEPGLYWLQLISGSRYVATDRRPGNIELSQSQVTVSEGSRHVVRVFYRADVAPPARPVAALASPASRQALLLGWVVGPNGTCLDRRIRPDGAEIAAGAD